MTRRVARIPAADVDEVSCIGCTFCADVAKNTFIMHPEAGRARAYAQGQDDPELVMEAIDTCPVKCARACLMAPPRVIGSQACVAVLWLGALGSGLAHSSAW